MSIYLCVFVNILHFSSDVCRNFVIPPLQCLAYMKRYTYNPRTLECEQFIYGGCGGNSNNFGSMTACQRKCTPGRVQPTTAKPETSGSLTRRGRQLSRAFYAPGLKGPPRASSVWIVRPSVCLSVCPSVHNSVPLIHKVQYLKFGWSYSNQTWMVSSSKGFSHFTDITCPWGRGGVNILDLEILPYLDFVATGGIRVSQTHV